MALETLKGVDKIGGFNVLHHEKPSMITGEFSPTFNYIIVDHGDNSIKFTMQEGPIKESGMNGVQVDALIHAAKKILEGLNEKFPCSQNHNAMAGLSVALASLEQRKEERESRDVEGTSKA